MTGLQTSRERRDATRERPVQRCYRRLAALICLLLALVTPGFAWAGCVGATRIISLLPSLTETLCYLGACDRLIATDRYANWPEEVKGLPKLGGLDGFSIEKAMSLRPDCVLVSRPQRETDRMAALGVEVWVLPMARLDDVDRVMREMISRFGLGDQARDAQKRWQDALQQAQQKIQNTIQHRIQHSVQDSAQNNAQQQAQKASAARPQATGTVGAGRSAESSPQRILMPIDRELYVFGRGSYWDDIFRRLGLENAIPASVDQHFPKLSLEWVLRHPPDRIVISPALRRELERLPGWSAQFQEERYCMIPRDLHDAVMRPGPRLLQAMDWFVACLGSR